MTSVEWKMAGDFDPFTKALDIPTNSVMAASSQDGGFFWDVFYTQTPTADPEQWVWKATIWRSVEGEMEVLRRERFRTIGQFNEELRERMEAVVGESGLDA